MQDNMSLIYKSSTRSSIFHIILSIEVIQGSFGPMRNMSARDVFSGVNFV